MKLMRAAAQGWARSLRGASEAATLATSEGSPELFADHDGECKQACQRLVDDVSLVKELGVLYDEERSWSGLDAVDGHKAKVAEQGQRRQHGRQQVAHQRSPSIEKHK